MIDIAAALREALALHKRGRLDEAELRYRQLLECEPNHFDALHLLGLIARQRGQAQLAVGLIERALAADDKQAIAWCNLGTAWQDLGASDRALPAFERAIALDPNYALAHNNRGNACRNLGLFEEALACYDSALRCKPDHADAALNRGTVLQQLGRHDEALAAYDAALKLRPDADGWSNRGSVLYVLGRFEEALQSMERALRLDARHASAWCNRGMTLQKLERHSEALESYDKALELRPHHAEAWLYRGNVLRLMEHFNEAAASYRRAREHGADAEQCAYFLAALGEGEAPPASPSAYVRNLFDRYAGHFDEHLVEVLHYRTPQLLMDALRQAGVPRAGDCADLGCGTGLAGALLQPHVHTLHGVDLSQAMLDRAAARGIYDSLDCEDLSAWLSRRPGAFNLAVAADVLVYLGDLAPLMQAARQALRAGGAFAFSVEETEAADYALQLSHRYAHSRAYVERVAGEAGFAVKHLERCVLRKEEGAEVGGLCVVLTPAC
ncbi:MAG TPA: tetratricopeptide repeat protein [Burkholderiaceae bacterium]